MKKFEWILPVNVYNKKKNSQSITRIKVKKVPEIMKILPQPEVIELFLKDQHDMVQAGKEFNAMQIMVPTATYMNLLQEIQKTIGTGIVLKSKSIDLVLDKVPVIQIIHK
jgi:hypothetical protein